MLHFYSLAITFVAKIVCGLKNDIESIGKFNVGIDETLHIQCNFHINNSVNVDFNNSWIDWLQNETIHIKKDEKYHITDSRILRINGTTTIASNLTIEETSVNDSGNYSCIFLPDVNKTNSPNNRNGENIKKYFFVSVTEIQKSIHLNFGEKLSIRCFFDTKKLKIGNKKSNGMQIIWFNNSTNNMIKVKTSQIHKISKIGIKFNNNASLLISELIIEEAFENDSGLYICTLISYMTEISLQGNFTIADAKNYTIAAKRYPVSVRDEQKVHNFVLTNIEDEYHELKTKIYNSLIMLPVMENSFAEEVGGKDEEVVFHWFKDNKKYLPYGEHTKFFKASYSIAGTFNCTQFDAGVYTVIASTESFTKNITFRVFIKSKPIMKMLYVQPEISNNLTGYWIAKCELYAYPCAVEIYWTFKPCYNLELNSKPYCRETQIISHDKKTNTQSSIDNGEIKIAELRFQPFASGILECNANNSIGEGTAFGNIIIENIVNPINVFSANEIYAGNRIELICESIVFFDDLKWYSVEHQTLVDSLYLENIVGTNLWLDVEISSEETDTIKRTLLIFKYIKESNQGDYECRGYKNFNYTSYESKIFQLEVKQSKVLLWLILLIIPLSLILAGGLYWYYRKITEVQPWMLLYDERFEFPADRIKIESELGSGAFGVVFEAVAEGILPNEPETIVAVKTIKKSSLNDSTLRSLESELEILLSLGKHLNIVNLLGAVTKNQVRYKLMVIVEFCSNGSLKNYLFENRSCFVSQIDTLTGVIHKEINNQTNGVEWDPHKITTNTLILWAFQIARGMDYVSSQKIVHGDLAARNILLAENNVVKICDFGLAKSMNYQYNYQSKGNDPLPLRWLAIETLESGLFSTYSDIWSYGVVLWELFSLCQEPYAKMPIDRFVLFDKLENGFRMSKPKFSNQEIYQIILDCWNQTPGNRPVFSDLENRFKNLLDDNICLDEDKIIRLS